MMRPVPFKPFNRPSKCFRNSQEISGKIRIGFDFIAFETGISDDTITGCRTDRSNGGGARDHNSLP